MNVALATNVLVIAMDEKLVPGLEQSTSEHQWRVLETPDLRRALQHVHMIQPEVVVVQLSYVWDAAMELIDRLHHGMRKVPVVAIGNLHDQDLEVAVRSAGVSSYFSGDAPSEAITQSIDNIVAARRRKLQPAGDRYEDASSMGVATHAA